MTEVIKASGIVLSAHPQGDQDKRIVIQTSELGKVTAFARGCRRPGNALLAAANPFAMGVFSLIPSGSAYRLVEADIKEYFRELAGLQPEVYFGFYFLDLCDYYGREGISGSEVCNLLYVALKALMNPKLSKRQVQRFFELRLFSINGDFSPESVKNDEGLARAADFVCRVELSKLFSFIIREDMVAGLGTLADRTTDRVMGRMLPSRRIMEDMM